MRAAVLTAYNSPLRVGELPDPVPGTGEVLVRVMAGGVNPLDTKIRRGEAAHAQMAPPAVLGIDMAGVVEAVGAGVDRFRVGDLPARCGRRRPRNRRERHCDREGGGDAEHLGRYLPAGTATRCQH